MSDGAFIDGTGITPGTERCKCGPACEFPCWQRLGWAPACSSCGCPPLEVDDDPARPGGREPMTVREAAARLLARIEEAAADGRLPAVLNHGEPQAGATTGLADTRRAMESLRLALSEGER